MPSSFGGSLEQDMKLLSRAKFPSEAQSIAGILHAGAEEEMLEKLKIFKSKTESNIGAMPKVLKKMNEYVAVRWGSWSNRI